MLVRNIAGKALASPATNGKPISAKTKQAAIAKPAAIPLIDRILIGTLFIPLGASRLFKLNIIARIASNTKPITPNIISLIIPSVTSLAIIRLKNAKIAQASNDDTTVRGNLKLSRAIYFGSIIQTPRNIPLISIPIGTTDMLAVNASSPSRA